MLCPLLSTSFWMGMLFVFAAYAVAFLLVAAAAFVGCKAQKK